MSLIDSLTNSQWFQLKDKSSAALSESNVETASNQEQNSAASLAEAFMLDLSPDARQALAQADTTAGSDSSDATQQFALNKKQLQAIDDILQKYKDAPFTQETYENIQADLEDANLSPESLALQDKLRSFNPIGILVSALSGNFTDAVNADDATLETKMDHYMGMIVDKWKDLSTTFDDTEIGPDSKETVDDSTETT